MPHKKDRTNGTYAREPQDKIQDPYDVLGLSPGATKEDIKSAYRRLALRYHPDKVKGDDSAKSCASKKFIEISAAYEMLTRPSEFKEKQVDINSSDSSTNTDPYSTPSSFHDSFFRRDTIGDPFLHPFYPFTDPFELFRRTFHDNRNGFLSEGFSVFSTPPDAVDFGNLFQFDINSNNNMHNGFNNFQLSRTNGETMGGMTSISTSTEIINGKRKTRTEKTILYPDGRRETSVHVMENDNDVEQSISNQVIADNNKNKYQKKREELGQIKNQSHFDDTYRTEDDSSKQLSKKRRFFQIKLPHFNRKK